MFSWLTKRFAFVVFLSQTIAYSPSNAGSAQTRESKLLLKGQIDRVNYDGADTRNTMEEHILGESCRNGKTSTFSPNPTSVMPVATSEPALGSMRSQRMSLLAQRDIIVVIDKSGSMATTDCPRGLSRWQWCCEQTRQLAESASSLGKEITVITFSDDYKVYKDTTPDTINRIFEEEIPHGGTEMQLPMEALLSDYFQRRSVGSVRPMSVAVITDGEPSEFFELRDEIISATQRLHSSSEISISFLKVGSSIAGNQVLDYLDHDLKSLGAQFDIVSHKSFEDLKREGLLVAMTDELAEREDQIVRRRGGVFSF
jgi:hypothetical protein